MDVARSPRRRSPWLLLVAGGVLLVALLVVYLRRPATLQLDSDRLRLATVETGTFYEYLKLDGRIEPAATYLIDSKLAGSVDRLYAESGATVRVGDTLLRLVNADLELDVMQRESQLLEQLNNQRQTRLLLRQDDLNRRAALVEVDFQLALQDQQFRRDCTLVREGLIARADYEPTANRLAYFRSRRDLLATAYRNDSLAQQRQLGQLSATEARLLGNLARVRAILDRLYVRAPVAGRLGAFALRAGQSVSSGDRLGEIYSLDDPLVVAGVDEFYLDKVAVGQRGQLEGRADSVGLTITKVYPSVEGGQFRIEARLDAGRGNADNFVRGQTVRFRLEFGTPRPSLLLPRGDFYASSGGHHVYRLGDDGRAERTAVGLGRSNPDYYEVVRGLRAGDRVIVSSYDGFQDFQTLTLN